MAIELPSGFLEMIASTGCDALQSLSDGMNQPSPVAIRLNKAKQTEIPTDATPVEWCPLGYYLDKRPQFIFDPALHQGLYYVQDASSMAHAAAVAKACEVIGMVIDRNLRYMDACAAPGGKTTAAIDVLPDNTLVVANEFDPRRTSILAENLAKWGYEGVVITREDASRMNGLNEFFDIIAADVPCSGEGMMRKDHQAIEQWSPKLIAECAARQRLIVENLWEKLRPGGCLIYSTCTFNLDENENIVRHMIDNFGAEVVEIEQLKLNNVIGTIGDNFPSYRFIPGKVRGEGQYIALLRKPGEQTEFKNKKNKNKKPKKSATIPSDATNLLDGDWKYSIDGETVYACRKCHVDDIETVDKHLYTVSKGIEVGTIKGRDFIPAQTLALARALRPDVFTRIVVDTPTAIEYLRRNAVTLDNAPRGIVLLTYNNKPLGFIKNLGNRANNLYPTNWRILSTPEK